MDLETIFFLLVICLFSSLVQGLTGFGLGIVAMAALPLLLPMREAVPFVAVLTTIACIATLKNSWHRVDQKEFCPLIIALLCGVPIGIWGLQSLPPALIKRLLGAALLLSCAQNILVPASRRLPRWTAGIFGLTSGILSGSMNVGGPPLLVYLKTRQIKTPVLIATLHLLFVFSGSFRSAWLLASGLITKQITIWLLVAVPFSILGYFSGMHIREKISEKWMSRILLTAIALLGTYYLIKG
ncbi:MAG: sulfite exporter TauE/SafE family protein [Chthoniobacterales bacterium]